MTDRQTALLHRSLPRDGLNAGGDDSDSDDEGGRLRIVVDDDAAKEVDLDVMDDGYGRIGRGTVAIDCTLQRQRRRERVHRAGHDGSASVPQVRPRWVPHGKVLGSEPIRLQNKFCWSVMRTHRRHAGSRWRTTASSTGHSPMDRGSRRSALIDGSHRPHSVLIAGFRVLLSVPLIYLVNSGSFSDPCQLVLGGVNSLASMTV